MADSDRSSFGLSAFHAAPDATVIVGRDGIIRHANERVFDVLGWPVADLEGRAVETLLPPALRSKHRTYRTDFFAAPRSRAMGSGRRLAALHADGTEIPVEISLAPIELEGEVYTMAAVRDVTAWRRIAEPPNLRPLLYLLIANAVLNAITLARLFTR